MSRKGTPDELDRLLTEIRLMYAQEHQILERQTEAAVITAQLDTDRRRLTARIERTWAVVREHMRSTATGEPMPANVDQIGTPALVMCPNCNGGGCGHCNGTGTTASREARDGAA